MGERVAQRGAGRPSGDGGAALSPRRRRAPVGGEAQGHRRAAGPGLGEGHHGEAKGTDRDRKETTLAPLSTDVDMHEADISAPCSSVAADTAEQCALAAAGVGKASDGFEIDAKAPPRFTVMARDGLTAR